jgi:hypothetical protein
VYLTVMAADDGGILTLVTNGYRGGNNSRLLKMGQQLMKRASCRSSCCKKEAHPKSCISCCSRNSMKPSEEATTRKK